MRNHRNKKPKFTKWLIIGIILLLIYAGYQYSRYNYIISTPVDPSDTQSSSFIIKKGESTSQIAQNLKEKNLILDEGTFKLFAKLSGKDRSIVAGRFSLSSSQTIPTILDVITDNRQSEVVLTVPEGSTVTNIDQELVELGLIETGEFIKAVTSFNQYDKYPFLDKESIKNLIYPLEGYLFPDTYFISANDFYSENLIQLMLQNFQAKLTEITNQPTERSLREYIIMASILEQEVNTSNDMPIVAGILWKRLDSGWMLGADATLLYNKDNREINYSDLQEDNPYNTRNRTGLPPGPITNPGLQTIKAAMFPQNSPYYFYLTTLDTGEVIYSVTNEEHNANKQKYL